MKMTSFSIVHDPDEAPELLRMIPPDDFSGQNPVRAGFAVRPERPYCFHHDHDTESDAAFFAHLRKR